VIGSLRGKLTRKEASRIVVETGGIGYLVHIPFSTFFALGDLGSEASLLIHTHVREDALQLFGFLSELELKAFDRLIGVSGIGPRMAVTILSGIPAAELVEAIRSSDVKRLCAVPGMGKKTSERLVVELRDKLDDIGPLASASPRSRAGDAQREDAVSALVNLGYRRKDAEDAVDRVASGGGLATVLRAALTLLAR
jgi:holliday junction DNA helicase RuvA